MPGTETSGTSWLVTARATGVAAALLGASVLLGWLVGSVPLTGWAAGLVPMAPSTALLFILFGGLLAAPGSVVTAGDVPPPWMLAASAAGGVVAAVLLTTSATGHYFEVEHLGLGISREVAGVPAGHMSPLTAVQFLLACVALLLLLTGPRDRRRARAAFALSALLLLIAVVLTIGYVLSAPLLYDTGAIPPAANTAVGFVLLGAGLMAGAVPVLWPDAGPGRDLRPGPGLLGAVFVLAAVLTGPAYFLFREYRSHLRDQVEAELATIADLKVDQIVEWRTEILRDAAAFYANPTFARLVDRAVYDDDPAARQELAAWLTPVARTFRYQWIEVVDSAGDPRLSISASGLSETPAEPHPHDHAAALRSGGVVFQDFHRHAPGDPVHLSVLAPILRQDTLLGGLEIWVDPTVHLYPTLLRWPTPSPTAETLLVRRDGDDVLFLNPLRFRPEVPLEFRLPLSRSTLPAARALLGDEGIVRGTDYRGEPVLAAIRRVPDTGWRLVARIDRSEAFAPLRERLQWLLAVVALLLLGGVWAAAFVWQRREKLHYQDRLRVEERHGTLLDSIGDAVIATDREGRVEVMNPVAERLTGWSEGEARGRPLEDVFRIISEETREPPVNPVSRVLSEGQTVGLANATLLIARDGSEVPIADSAAPVRDPDGRLTGVILVFRDQTEEWAARAALRRSEARHRNLFNSIRDAILVADTDRRIIDCNPAFTELFGYTLDEIRGKPTSEVHASEAEYREIGERLLEHMDDPSFIHVSRYRKKSAEVFPAETSAFYLRDDAGAVVGFIGLIRDITEWRAAAEALAVREEQYRTLFEDAPVGIFRTRSDGGALEANPAMARILGFDSPEAAVAHYTDLGHQLYVDPARRDDFLQQLRQHGRVRGFQYRAAAADGQIRWLEMDARIDVEHEDGTFEIEGFTWDITDRQQAQHELRKRQDMLERTERLARIGSWEMDVGTGAVTWSDEMFRIFGRAPAQGAPSLEEHAELLGSGDMERLSGVVRRAIEEGESYDLEIEVIRPDGTVRQCRARGFPERAPDGAVATLYGSVDDITERKRREEEERSLRAQLGQAQKMESVGRLAGGVAHDFNNMLAVILGHAELVRERLDEDSGLLDDLREIEGAAERSASLTKQLLAFAREQVADPRILDLNEKVEGLLKMLRRLIGEDTELVWRPVAEALPINMDPAQLDQVLINLVVNARDAIEGVGTITIETDRVDIDQEYAAEHAYAVPGDFTTLTVTDTGSGMDPNTLECVFEPFFTTKSTGEGTGLGLSTVFGVVQQNGGFVKAYSEVGEGSVFRVYLPRAEDSKGDGSARAHDTARASGGTETILIVEDQPAVLGLARKILDRLGYRTLLAETPMDALELARAHAGDIDLLITDVVMPEMNGRELAEKFTASYPDMAVLFMSGYPSGVIADRGILDAGTHFLQKPFTVKELGLRVRQALDNRTAHPAE